MGRIIPYIMENKKCLKPPTIWVRIMPKILVNGKDYPIYYGK